jgi:hypothetical protein
MYHKYEKMRQCIVFSAKGSHATKDARVFAREFERGLLRRGVKTCVSGGWVV